MKPNFLIMFLIMFSLFMLAESCQAGEWYIEAGVGKNDIFDKEEWEGRESMACMLGAGWETRKGPWKWELAYRHHSQCTRGNGFDSRGESQLDSAGLFVRYYFL